MPQTLPAAGEHHDWPVTGWAMLARSAGTLDSVMALLAPRRAADAAVLARALYEQTVTFAWIGIDPEEHARRWVRWDRMYRVKLDNDLQDVDAEPILDADARAAFDEEKAGAQMPDNLIQRAQEADKFWAPKTHFLDADPTSTRSLRGMYRLVYRGLSPHAHAAVASVESYVIFEKSKDRTHVLGIETMESRATTPFTNAAVLFALQLAIAEHVLELPPIEPVLDQIFGA